MRNNKGKTPIDECIRNPKLRSFLIDYQNLRPLDVVNFKRFLIFKRFDKYDKKWKLPLELEIKILSYLGTHDQLVKKHKLLEQNN